MYSWQLKFGSVCGLKIAEHRHNKVQQSVREFSRGGHSNRFASSAGVVIAIGSRVQPGWS